MSFLAHSEIQACIDRGQLFELNPGGDLDAQKKDLKRNVKQSSYDLRLGAEVYVVGEGAPHVLTEEEPYLTLPPGQFAILTSFETIALPASLMAFISVRSQYKFQGLVNISGFHVDPSFSGTLRFAVQNVGPSDVHLKFREPTFTIFFAKLTSDDIGPTRESEPGVHYKQHAAGIRLDDIQLLGGSSITLSAVHKDLDRLKTLVTVYGAAAISAFLAILLKLLFS